MLIRPLIAALLFAVALVALATPAGAHHRPGHSGGPGTAQTTEEAGGDDEGEGGHEGTEGGGAYGHGGEGEEGGQGAGVGISLAVIAAAVVLIAAIGLKPGGAAPAHH